MILLHMGALHPFEKALTLALAFGPFLILAVVLVVRRRQDRTEGDGEVQEVQEAQRDR